MHYFVIDMVFINDSLILSEPLRLASFQFNNSSYVLAHYQFKINSLYLRFGFYAGHNNAGMHGHDLSEFPLAAMYQLSSLSTEVGGGSSSSRGDGGWKPGPGGASEEDPQRTQQQSSNRSHAGSILPSPVPPSTASALTHAPTLTLLQKLAFVAGGGSLSKRLGALPAPDSTGSRFDFSSMSSMSSSFHTSTGFSSSPRPERRGPHAVRARSTLTPSDPTSSADFGLVSEAAAGRDTYARTQNNTVVVQQRTFPDIRTCGFQILDTNSHMVLQGPRPLIFLRKWVRYVRISLRLKYVHGLIKARSCRRNLRYTLRCWQSLRTAQHEFSRFSAVTFLSRLSRQVLKKRSERASMRSADLHRYCTVFVILLFLL